MDRKSGSSKPDICHRGKTRGPDKTEHITDINLRNLNEVGLTLYTSSDPSLLAPVRPGNKDKQSVFFFLFVFYKNR